MHVKKVKIWKGGRRKVTEAKDFGTPEQQYRRIVLAGGKPVPAEFDGKGSAMRVTRWKDADEETQKFALERTSCPVDVLLLRGWLTQDEHTACVLFAGVRKLLFGKPTPPAIDLTRASGASTPDEISIPKAERAYRYACAKLMAAGGEVFKLVEELVVHEEWPENWRHWIGMPRKQTRHWEALAMMRGMEALADWAATRK